MLKSIATLLVLLALLPTANAVQPPPGSEMAVLEYLELRQSGDAHRAALAKVKVKFKITEDDFEKAANRVASQGYTREEDTRKPSSKK